MLLGKPVALLPNLLVPDGKLLALTTMMLIANNWQKTSRSGWWDNMDQLKKP